MGDLYEKPHFTTENFKFLWLSVGVENFWAKEKGTPLHQIWSNKSFGVCASSGVLMLYGGEKNSTSECPLKTRFVYNTASLPRCCDTNKIPLD